MSNFNYPRTYYDKTDKVISNIIMINNLSDRENLQFSFSYYTVLTTNKCVTAHSLLFVPKLLAFRDVSIVKVFLGFGLWGRSLSSGSRTALITYIDT